MKEQSILKKKTSSSFAKKSLPKLRAQNNPSVAGCLVSHAIKKIGKSNRSKTFINKCFTFFCLLLYHNWTYVQTVWSLLYKVHESWGYLAFQFPTFHFFFLIERKSKQEFKSEFFFNFLSFLVILFWVVKSLSGYSILVRKRYSVIT